MSLTDSEKFAQSEVKQDELHKERIERCKPVALKLLDILHSHQTIGTVAMGENDEVKKSLTLVAEEIIAMFLKENINWVDRQLVYQLAMQPIAHLGEILETAFGISWDRALNNMWGKDIIDLKIEDVHNALGGTQLVDGEPVYIENPQL